jgi:dynein heavy chain
VGGAHTQQQGKDETGKAVQDYWKPSLTLPADRDLIARLKSYDKDNIPTR